MCTHWWVRRYVLLLTTANFGGFSNFCRYYTGKSTGYRPTLKPLRRLHSSVGTHVASLISGYTCRFTHIMMIPDQPVAIWSELIMKVEFKNVWRCQGGNQKRQCDGQTIQWSKEKDKHCQQSSTPIFTDIGGIVDHINILFRSENYRANKGNM
jgi:hypothetical protein